ncbi:hypothetical protein [Neisseria montereyensis]|uniref:Secreted protein n=1 Tax=Neisseria montereyensis TaxID=2973938 RepID=A0ABT2FAF3_9NEIS|nr:hypothetical protein [Neisseria montereyensis]MCS4533188.1 hypothetical protein [Neisseria montereyensis]
MAVNLGSNKQKILIAVLLLLFAAVKVGGLLWWKNSQPDVRVMAESECNVQKGCHLPNGADVAFIGQVSIQTPFDIVIHNVPSETQEVYVSFSMRDMDMGFNRYKLVRQEGGKWAANQIRLPICTEDRHDYLADIHIGGEVFQMVVMA